MQTAAFSEQRDMETFSRGLAKLGVKIPENNRTGLRQRRRRSEMQYAGVGFRRPEDWLLNGGQTWLGGEIEDPSDYRSLRFRCPGSGAHLCCLHSHAGIPDFGVSIPKREHLHRHCPYSRMESMIAILLYRAS